MKNFSVIIILLLCGFTLDNEFITEEDVDSLSDANKFHHEQNIENNSDGDYTNAKILVINNISAKSKIALVKLNEVVFVDNLSIKLHKCYKKRENAYFENSALLSVYEHKLDADEALMFHGWMMSYNRSISVFEHPIYSILIEKCF
jgi:hypothetical protein